MPGSETSRFTKTRLAPTPSGYLHLGNLYSFALTAALAEKENAIIVLRIDDMDRERCEATYVEDVFENLAFMDIPWQEGPRDSKELSEKYSQHRRMDLYESELQRLVDMGLVYACSCSRKEVESLGGSYPGICRHKNLPLNAEQVCWRLNTSENRILKLKEYDGKVSECKLPEVMKDFVIRRKDGLPAYQLCSLVDDVYFGVDLVVRGEDLLPSTLAQLYLAHVLGKMDFLNASFYHHTLLMGDEGLKLSKSAGSTSLRYFHKQGKSQVAIYNLLGEALQWKQQLNYWKDLMNEINNQTGKSI